MSILLRNFAFSAKEFKSIKSIVAAALLIALHTVLAVFVSIQVTPTLRISVSFLANCAIGYMFGPVMGFVCGGLGDLIGLRYSMFLLFITLGYILSISYWAKPLVKNETVSLKELLKQLNRTK